MKREFWLTGQQTHVAIHQWATYKYSQNFTEPLKYRPERFLNDPKYANDRKEAIQPFSFGPRNCIGKK